MSETSGAGEGRVSRYGKESSLADEQRASISERSELVRPYLHFLARLTNTERDLVVPTETHHHHHHRHVTKCVERR
jgi:hypothetical protein